MVSSRLSYKPLANRALLQEKFSGSYSFEIECCQLARKKLQFINLLFLVIYRICTEYSQTLIQMKGIIGDAIVEIIPGNAQHTNKEQVRTYFSLADTCTYICNALTYTYERSQTL